MTSTAFHPPIQIDNPEADRRVSRSEQEDYQVPEEAPSNGDVLLLIAPILLTLIGAVALVVSFIR